MEIKKSDKIATLLKKHYNKISIPYFIAGLVITNIGILCGIGLYHIEEVITIKWFFLTQPLFCMYFSYEICNYLYNKSHQSSLKNLLHYMYILFYIISIGIGFAYCLTCNINSYLFLSIIYSMIFLVEFIYWRLYIQKYKKIFMKDLKFLNKERKKNGAN